MDFNDLKLFLHLSESKNFSKTAVQNHMSTSTLSRQIQRMEEELGEPLFLRDNRRVALTDCGEKFQIFAKQNWYQWQQFKQQLQIDKTQLSGELRLFCSVTASYSHLPKIIEKFRTHYPFVEIKLMTGDPASALGLVQSQTVDLAIAGKPDNLPSSIAFHKIDDLELSLIAPRIACPATYLLQQNPIDWQQMPFIFPEQGHARQRIEYWLNVHKKIKHPKIYATVAGHEGIVPMVALGCGLAMLPDAVIKNSPIGSQVSIFQLDNPVAPFELGVCVQKKYLQQPLIRAFWETLE
ncbi:HTH-type transcriptional activator IlvY [Pasteurella bettyae]|mgnify:CR=1 FL=1|uniref:HTH-type transcriptional activator IlvY n=1 Tax=Pasteurella bettyae CCUG 2042 TaxID=1095749 RepID=I3D9Y9_9PAST|nr:HTH-type transcriptional activator IlvY [Pasteurella bettyae]EIJ68532.1 HTH-type transcriptional activator IlvY [Pasteurella bettyae CCUG 2042]SUB22753.1 DNA-binding transcriptional regulator IlvY [Pasteurella bettyae]